VSVVADAAAGRHGSHKHDGGDTPAHRFQRLIDGNGDRA